jgi:hypothetical protein
MMSAGCGADRRVVDPAAAPFDVGQHDGESVAADVLELDLDRIIVSDDTDIRGDRGCAQFSSHVNHRRNAGVDDLAAPRPFVGSVWSSVDHLRVAVNSDHRGEREELAVTGELLLRKVDRDGKEAVEVSLRLRRGDLSPR